ncbi:MAG: PilZ domain-containing protein [Proteobacteria bacterium]|nr:PilZ domain-containing protein [Pseudomonadota bacterium]
MPDRTADRMLDAIERRRHPRLTYGAWVEDELQGGLGFYVAVNLSLGGLLLRSKDPPPPVGHRVRLRLVIENETRVMSVYGEVVRHVGGAAGEFAVRFVNLDPVRREFLDDLVREVAAPVAT